MKLDLKEWISKMLGMVGDTGWQPLTHTGGGTLQYRIVNHNVYIIGASLTVTHNASFCTLPTNIIPSIRITASASFPLDKNVYVNNDNGNLAGVQNGGGTITQLYFNMSYPI